MAIRRHRAESTGPDTGAPGGRPLVSELTEPASGIDSAPRQRQKGRNDQALIETLNRTIEELASIADVADVLESALRQIIEFDRLALFIKNTDSDTFSRARPHSHAHPENAVHEGVELNAKKIEDAFGSRQTITPSPSWLHKAPPRTGADKPEPPGFGSSLAARLTYRGELIGLIVLQREDPDAFDEADCHLIETISGQVTGAVANVHLTEIQHLENMEQEAISNIARAIAESPSLDAALERLAPLLSSLMDFERLTVFFRRADTHDYDRYHVSGTKIVGCQKHDLVHMDDKFFMHFFRGESMKRFSMEELEEVQRMIGSESTGREVGLGDCLSAVLTYKDERVGLIVLRASAPDSFTRSDARLLENVAAQIAGIVAHMQLVQLRERELAEKLALTQILQALSSTLDFAEVPGRAAEALKPLIEFDRFGVTVIDESTMQGSRMFGWPDPPYLPDHVNQPAWHLRGTFHQLAITTRGPVSIGDHNRDELSRRLPILKRSFEAGLRSGVTAPVFHEGRIIASVSMQSSSRPSFSKADIALLENVAIQIGPAIVNATLYQQTAEESRRRAILGEIGRIVSSSPDISDVYDQFAKKLRELLPIDRVVIRIVDETGLTATHTYADGISGPQGGVEASFILAGTTTAQIVQTRSPLVLSEQNSEEMATRFPHLSRAMQSGLISGLSVPLISGDDVIGVLHVGSTTPNSYGQREIESLEAVAAQISGAIANSRLRRQAKEEANERAVLAEISRIVTSSPDLESTFERFAEEAKKIIRFDRISIALIDQETATLEVAYSDGMPIPGIGKGFRIPLRASYTARAMTSKTAITLDSAELQESASRYHVQNLAFESDLKSLLIAPLVWRDTAIGALYLRSKESHRYSDDELNIASQIAAQISGAVENSRLHLAARDEASRQAVLGEIGRIVGSSLDIDDIYERFATAARKLIPFDRVVISLVDIEADTVTDAYVAGIVVESTPMGFTDRLSDTIVADMVEDPKTRIYHEDDLLAEPRQAGALKIGLRSLLLVPLCWGDDVIGTLNFRSRSPAAYDASMARFAEQIGAQIAGTIANARLHAQTMQDAHRQAILAEIGRVASSSLNMANIFQPLAGKVREIIAFDRLVVTFVDQDRDRIEIAYVEGLAVESAAFGAVMPLNGTPLAEAARTLRPVVFSVADLDDVVGGLEGVARRTAAGLKSRLIAPLIWHSEAIGFLTFESCSEKQYSEDESQVAERIAAQIAGAVANAEFHARSMQLAGEREARIKLDAENRELHEIEQERGRFISTVSHELRTPLTSISAFSDLLARNKKGHLDERELQQIGLVRKNAQRLNILINDLFDITKMNAGSFELNLEEFDVRQLLQELSDSLSPMFGEKNQKLIVSLPDDDIWVNADRDRIAQVISNLLSNASKYSPEASQIDLDLRARDGQVCMRVRDRGMGISRADQRRLFTPFFRADNEETRKVAGTGLGLVVTKSIVEMHGGAINLTSTPGKGSCFEVEIPEAQPGPSLTHIERMAQADLPAEPVSRLDALDADSANIPSPS